MMRTFVMGLVGVVLLGGALHAQNGSEALPPMAADAKPVFEVVTIKPSDPNRRGGGYTVRGRHVITINRTVKEMISYVYGAWENQILGGPSWSSNDRFDIDGVPDLEGMPSQKQIKEMMQKLLADRFGLTIHHEKRELPAYAVVVGKNGAKLSATTAKPDDPVQFMSNGSNGHVALTVVNATMQLFADGMGGRLDRPVVDQTGLTGRYDFVLKWTPDEAPMGKDGKPLPVADANDPNAPPGLFTAIQEQLGLKLEPTKTKVDVIVIDGVEKLSEN